MYVHDNVTTDRARRFTYFAYYVYVYCIVYTELKLINYTPRHRCYNYNSINNNMCAAPGPLQQLCVFQYIRGVYYSSFVPPRNPNTQSTLQYITRRRTNGEKLNFFFFLIYQLIDYLNLIVNLRLYTFLLNKEISDPLA